MFTRADFALYVAIIATLGEVGLDAVTTNLNINFLAKPEPRDLVARVNLIRLGRRLAVGEVQIYSDGAPDMVAHAIGTYALPARDR
jgi:acyl-coenzyme A thioesterase PaaI-like protein